MKKPQIKKEVAAFYAQESIRIIRFFATPDEAGEFEEYGYFITDQTHRNQYGLFVDPRFDFREVLEYIDPEYYQRWLKARQLIGGKE